MKRVCDADNSNEVPNRRMKSNEAESGLCSRTDLASSSLANLLSSSEFVTRKIFLHLTIGDLASLSGTSKSIQTSALRHVFKSPFSKRQFYLLSVIERQQEEETVEAMGSAKWRGTLEDVVKFVQIVQTDTAVCDRVQFVMTFVSAIDRQTPDPTAWTIFATPYTKVTNISSILLLTCGSFCVRLVSGLHHQQLVKFVATVLSVATNLQNQLNTFFAPFYELGSFGEVECVIRNYIYYCFWAQVPEEEKGEVLFSALSIFAGDCHKRQALLLYLTFGPIKSVSWDDHNEVIPSVFLPEAAPNFQNFVSWVMWDEIHNPMCESDLGVTSQLIKPLADALSALHKYYVRSQKKIDHDYECKFMQMLNSLFSPDDGKRDKWDEKNVAALLLFGSEDLRRCYLVLRLLETSDISGLLVHILILSAQFDFPVQTTSDLFGYLFGSQDDSSFPNCQKLTTIESFWSELVECMQDVMATNADSYDFNRVPTVAFVAQLGRNMMHLAYPATPKAAKKLVQGIVARRKTSK